MSVLRFPVDCIYEWYCGLDEFYKFAVGFTIAGAVGMKDFRRDNFAPFVEEYLTQRHSVSGHMGRAISIRAIIDWYFWKERRRDDLTMHLEDVETGSPLIRQYANQAIMLHPERRQVLESVFDTWRVIREAELSDESLECTESRLIAHQLGLPDPGGSEGS